MTYSETPQLQPIVPSCRLRILSDEQFSFNNTVKHVQTETVNQGGLPRRQAELCGKVLWLYEFDGFAIVTKQE